MESEDDPQPTPTVIGYQSWFAVRLGGPWDTELRKALVLASKVSSAGQSLPPFVSRELHRRGVTLVPFVQLKH